MSASISKAYQIFSHPENSLANIREEYQSLICHIKWPIRNMAVSDPWPMRSVCIGIFFFVFFFVDVLITSIKHQFSKKRYPLYRELSHWKDDKTGTQSASNEKKLIVFCNLLKSRVVFNGIFRYDFVCSRRFQQRLRYLPNGYQNCRETILVCKK